MSQFIPQTILITGATGGIGSALAEVYAEKGKTLFLTGTNDVRLEMLASRCREKGAKVVTKIFDITDSILLSEWLSEITLSHPIDLVIANAGIAIQSDEEGRLEPLEATHRLFDVNLTAVVNTIYLIVPHMRENKRGQIALMSSLAAFRGLPHSPAYCASKAAIKIYAESIRGLCARDRINVAVICPGFVKTAMSDQHPGPKPYLMSPEQAAKIIKNKLQKRKALIVFPKSLWLSIKIVNLLPRKWADKLLVRAKFQQAKNLLKDDLTKISL